MRLFFYLVSLWTATASLIMADTVLLGDISYQPDNPIGGINSIVLDNFTDLADLGCSTTFPVCSGLNISGTLDVMYTDSLGMSQNALVPVGSTGPGSTPIYEFDPTQITLDSAVLTGTFSPVSFLVVDGNTFNSTGSFTSDTLTPDNGFAIINATGNEGSAVPEPASSYLIVIVVMTLGAVLWRRRSA